MQAFTRHTGLAVPLDRANVDTDQFIPKQFLKSIRRRGFGANLFDEWRYLDPGRPGQDPSERRPNPNFILLPGMFVRARIEEGVVDNAVLVPQVGVTHDPQGRATALVVGPDNKVAVRTLKLKGTRGDQWIAQGGLADGDRVIVAGLQRVQPGAVVQASESPVATAVATSSAPPASAASKETPNTVVSQAN